MIQSEPNSATTSAAAALSVGIAMLLAAMSFAAAAQTAPVSASASPAIVDAAAVPASMASITRATPVGRTIHVTLGHAIFINTKMRLRRVYVADPNVITSATLTPRQIVVTAMTPGLSSLTLLDETGLAQSYIVSSDVDVEGLRAALAETTHGGDVHVEAVGGKVTLTGTVHDQATSDAIVKLASQYAKDVANAMTVTALHPKQVRLQVRILEVDRTKALQLGINLFAPGGFNTVGAVTSSPFPSSALLHQSTSSTDPSTISVSNALNFWLYNFKYDIGAAIQDLQTKQVLQILAEPTITTISGEKGDFLAGGEFPFPMVQPGGNGGTPVVAIQFRPFGVKLEFTPFVNDDGTVRLKVAPEVSSLDYANAVTVSGFTVPALSTRRAETDVELRSDQSFAISGLLDQRTTDIMSKNPGAANIPILGNLFKAKNSNRSTTELVIIVTPTVVDPITDTAPPEQPKMPIKPLERNGFDKSLGRDLNPQPTPPAINPAYPPYGGDQHPQAAPQPAGPAATAPLAPAAPEPATPPVGTGAKQESAPAPEEKPKQEPAAKSKQGSGQPDTAVAQANAGAPQRPSAASPTGTDATTVPGSMVEIVTLSHESDGDAMMAALRRRGYNPVVQRTPQDSLLHVDVGPFPDRKEAEAMRQRLLSDGFDAAIR